MLAVPLLVCLYLPMYYGIDAILKALFLVTVIVAFGKCSEQKPLALAVSQHVQMHSSHTAWVEVVDAFMIEKHQHEAPAQQRPARNIPSESLRSERRAVVAYT